MTYPLYVGVLTLNVVLIHIFDFCGYIGRYGILRSALMCIWRNCQMAYSKEINITLPPEPGPRQIVV